MLKICRKNDSHDVCMHLAVPQCYDSELFDFFFNKHEVINYTPPFLYRHNNSQYSKL